MIVLPSCLPRVKSHKLVSYSEVQGSALSWPVSAEDLGFLRSSPLVRVPLSPPARLTFCSSLTTTAVPCGESAGDQHHHPVPHCPALGTSEASAAPASRQGTPPSCSVIGARPQPHQLRLCSEQEAQASPSRHAAFLQRSQRPSQLAPARSHRRLQPVPPATTEACWGAATCAAPATPETTR